MDPRQASQLASIESYRPAPTRRSVPAAILVAQNLNYRAAPETLCVTTGPHDEFLRPQTVDQVESGAAIAPIRPVDLHHAAVAPHDVPDVPLMDDGDAIGPSNTQESTPALAVDREPAVPDG